MLQKLELEHELLGVWGTTTTPGLEGNVPLKK
ncbi:hypothetical protein HaLaN_19461, partial [Haematococcus lacustris]